MAKDKRQKIRNLFYWGRWNHQSLSFSLADIHLNYLAARK